MHSSSTDGQCGLDRPPPSARSSSSLSGMMNHQMPAGPGQHMQPAMPMHPQSRRQQEYHTYHHPPPQSPIHPHTYANYHHPQYYPHPAQHQYPPPQRWQPQYHPQYMPPPQQQPQPQYQPRSPMVVSSQLHAQSMTPVTRHTPIPPALHSQASHSPRPIPQHVHSQQQIPQAPPSPAPTPKQEQTPQQGQQETDTPQAPPSRRQSQVQNPLSMPPEYKTPYYPQLPWYSIPNGQANFPPRAMARRRKRQNLHKSADTVALPARENVAEEQQTQKQAPAEELPSESSTIAAPSEPETPATSQAPSESDFTQVSTPATPAHASIPSPKATPTQMHARRDTRTAIAVPNIPGLPKPKASPSAADKQDVQSPPTEAPTPTQDGLTVTPAAEQSAPAEEQATPKTPPPKPAPKSWADLVRIKAGPGAAAVQTNGPVVTNGIPLSKSASLSEALKQYSVRSDATLPFLEPRGLVNTGNMCYMNAVNSPIRHADEAICILTTSRFSKCLFSAPHSSTSWIKCGNGLFIQ